MGKPQFPIPVSVILLDLDGTLVDSAPELAAAANAMLAEMARPPAPQDILMSYIGNGIGWLVKRALTGDMHKEPDPALFEAAMPIFEKHYRVHLLQSTLYDGVLEGLDAMRKAGFPLGCITNKAARFTNPLVEGLGLSGYFGIVVSGDTLPEKKPHPLPLLHAADALGAAPAKTLVIGDSKNDVLAARAAGCPVFCVPYGYNHGRPVAELVVDAVIEKLPDALQLIEFAP